MFTIIGVTVESISTIVEAVDCEGLQVSSLCFSSASFRGAKVSSEVSVVRWLTHCGPFMI